MLKFKRPKLFGKKPTSLELLTCIDISSEMLDLLQQLKQAPTVVINESDIVDIAGVLYDVDLNVGIAGGKFTTCNGTHYMFGENVFGIRKPNSAWHVTTITPFDCSTISLHVRQMTELKDILTEVALSLKIDPLKPMKVESMTKSHIAVKVKGSKKLVVIPVEEYSPNGNINIIDDGVIAYCNRYAID